MNLLRAIKLSVPCCKQHKMEQHSPFSVFGFACTEVVWKLESARSRQSIHRWSYVASNVSMSRCYYRVALYTDRQTCRYPRLLA